MTVLDFGFISCETVLFFSFVFSYFLIKKEGMGDERGWGLRNHADMIELKMDS